MVTYVPPKVNTELIFYIGLVSQADTKLFQTNPTLATGDFKVSIDGGTLNNLGTLPVVTPASGKLVKVLLSNTEMNGANINVVGSDAAGAEWCDIIINIQTAARQTDDLAYPATTGRSLDVDASGLVALSATSRNAVADSFLARNIAGGSSTGRTIAQAIAAMRNRVAISGTTVTVYDTDDVTPLWTGTIVRLAGASPVISVDPA